MTNEQSNMDAAVEERLSRTTQTPPAFWIPFEIASIGLVVIGLFRFSKETESIYFIYICLIAFAVAVFPWISSIRMKGIIEIDRAIDNVREENRERIEQTSKRFDDRLLLLRTELVAQLSSIQIQAAQQTSRQESSHVIQINPSLQGVEVSEKLLKSAVKQTDRDESKATLPTSSELPEKYSELRIGFAKATSVALNDPLGFRCGNLLNQVPSTGQTSEKFEEARLNFNVTDEQLTTMKILGLITIGEGSAEEPDGAIISITELGLMYSNYWTNTLQIIDWNKIKSVASLASKIIPLLVRVP